MNALADKKQDDPKRYATLTKIDPIQGWVDWDELLAERKAVIVFNVMPEDAEFPFYRAGQDPEHHRGERPGA